VINNEGEMMGKKPWRSNGNTQISDSTSAKSPSPFLHLNDLFILLVLLSRKKKALMSLILLVPLFADVVQTNVAIKM
jgi:hypothetical protein